ncbi:MAG: DUF4097 family beta strand repeat-containing protein [Bacteroidetes bacterium]|nr:DUF4097 family beta strand repeat-containing protein [Bacteroidota bacterium]MCY4233577.1 DUF4097 family beta strand repeat-containing protein [Bacteroidota bacterium]
MRILLRFLPITLSLIFLSSSVFAQDTFTAIDEKYSVKDVDDIDLNVLDAHVTVNKISGSSISIQIFINGRDSDAARDYFESQNFSVELNNRSLIIESNANKFVTISYDWDNSPDIQVIIGLPPNIPAKLRTSDGDINVDELTAGVEIKTSDGDISLGSVSGDRIAIQTSDGDINAQSLQSPAIKIQTSDGDLYLETVNGESTQLQTSDGDILVKSVTGKMNARTSDGDLAIGKLISAGAQLNTSDGDIIVDAVSGSVSIRSGDGDVVLGIIEPEEVSVSVNDGDVVLAMPQTISATLDIDGADVSMDEFDQFIGTISDTNINGDLNGGGAMIRVRTSDGEVAIVDENEMPSILF